MPRILFGRDTFRTLPRIIRDYGRKVLVVTGGSSFKASGKMDELTGFLSQNKITIQHLEISGEPSPSMIDRAVNEYRRLPVNVVIAIGGGSVIDAGKAVSAMLAEDGSVTDYLEGVGTKKLSGVKAPFIAVPTTSGTGSEATKNAVLTVVGPEGFKKSLRHDNYIPDVALIDPSLMTSCPPSLTAACGMDTLSQLIESYISKGSSAFTDALAESGIEAFASGFLPSFSDGTDIAAREKMAYASLMSGICLAHAGLGTVHGIAGPLGSRVSIPHGVACGTILGEVMAEFAARSGEWDALLTRKMIRIGQLLDASDDKSDKVYIEGISSAIKGLIDQTGIPKLSAYGVGEEHLTRIVAGADNKASPVALDPDTMLAVLRRRI